MNAGMSVNGNQRANAPAGVRTRALPLARLADERGQMLPLVVLAIIGLVAAGMVVFGLGFASSLKSQAQTGADAAALGGMQTLNDEWNTPHYLDGVLLPPTYDPTAVRTSAENEAAANHVTLTSISFPLGSSGEPDVEVSVSTQQVLPHGTLEAGQGSTAQARASTDPSSQNSPTITPTTTTLTCVDDASSGTVGTVFSAHSGPFGFFPGPQANFTNGCEMRLAGQIDALGLASPGRHIVGVAGYASTQNAQDQSAIAQAHACGAAATVQGLPTSVSDKTLKQFKLTRPFPGHPDELELIGKGCTTDTGQATTTPAPVTFGNGFVHLVPLSGGPQAALFAGLTGPIMPTESQLQVACTIYNVWKQVQAQFSDPTKALLVALTVASDESSMGQNLGPSGGSYGVFQQTPPSWGSVASVLDVPTATKKFLFGVGTNKGLYQWWPSDQNMPVWWIAQDVQVSGAGQSTHGSGNYGSGPVRAMAQTYYDKVMSGGCPKNPGP